MLNWHNFIMTTQIVKEYDQIFSLIVRRNSRFQVKHISARWVRYFHSFCYVTYARIGTNTSPNQHASWFTLAQGSAILIIKRWNAILCSDWLAMLQCNVAPKGLRL